MGTAPDVMIGLGSKFYAAPTSTSTAYVQVIGLDAADGPGPSGTKIDTSTLDSTSRFASSKGGLVEPGDVSLSFAYLANDPGQVLMANLLASGVEGQFKVELPSTAQADETFVGTVNGGGRAITRGTKTLRPFTIGVSGEPGWPSTPST